MQTNEATALRALPAIFLLTATLSLATATSVQSAVTAAKVATVAAPQLHTTFTNPTPAYQDYFGVSMAAVGTDRVLIGAYGDDTGASDAGAAYLFSTNGILLTTFTNPTPAANDSFGWSVAAVGTDRVLIGASYDDTGVSNAGAAYLLSTDGTLLTTFTKPTPEAHGLFGASVAAVGTHRVLIGAPTVDTGAGDAGAAYLFSTNGALLTTFTNPTPAASDNFGLFVAAVGTDGVLIAARYDDTGALDAGAAYLFSTNGTLLTTFTNPTPEANGLFGFSAAAVGTDKVLIGAHGDGTGAFRAGAAYLFSTSGALLTTFTKPTPAANGLFGWSVAAVGTDRVLIGALFEDTGAMAAGAAYLFSTSGAFLTTFTNPAPEFGDFFGNYVTAVGTDRVLIGAYQDDTGASTAGAAYLFSLEPFTPTAPSLSTIFNPQLSTLTVSWPAPAEGWMLERTNALSSVAASSWPPVPPPYQTNAGTISVTFTNLPATGNQFFRLHKP